MARRPVLTAEAMQGADRQTIETYGIPGFTLMESAGRGATEALLRRFGSLRGRRVIVLAGKGNNGGDGLVMARQLYLAGAGVHVVHLGTEETSSPDAARNLRLLRQLQAADTEERLHLHPFEDLSTVTSLPPADLLVDALLGTGLTRALRSPILELVQWINSRPEPCVAVDIPTGLDSNTGVVHGEAVRATFTPTMAAAKVGLLINEGPEYAGEVEVIEIGIPPFILETAAREPGCAWQASDALIRSWLPPRTRKDHKYRIGLLLAIVGSSAYPGAAEMASRAAARVGAGMVITATPASARPILATKLTEVVTRPLPETEAGTVHPDALETLKEPMERARALLVGCGLGRHPETTRLVQHLITSTTLPGVLDADGLFALAGATDLLTRHAGGRWILTPHIGEFRRLTGEDLPYPLEDRVRLVQHYARRWQVVLLLKGFPSIVADPEGTTYINATGNPGVASAGHGDVLAGLCGGLLAQGLSPLQAAVAALHIGGAVADAYVQRYPARTLVAPEIIHLLPDVMHQRFA